MAAMKLVMNPATAMLLAREVSDGGTCTIPRRWGGVLVEINDTVENGEYKIPLMVVRVEEDRP